MKILVIGGMGYFGRVVTGMLSQEHEVTVWDNCMFGRERIGVLPNVKLFDDIDVLKNGLDQDNRIFVGLQDAVVWCCDLDVEQWFVNEQSVQYVQRNTEVFKKYCEILRNRMFFITRYYDGDCVSYREMIDKKIDMARLSCGNTFATGCMYGPSPVMRYDNVLNGMFRSSCAEGAIVVDDWLKRVRACSVAKMADYVKKAIERHETHSQALLWSYNMSLIEYAHFMNKVFGDKLKIIPLNVSGICEETPSCGYRVEFLVPGDKTIEKSFGYMLKYCEKNGAVEDLFSDSFDNTRMVGNYLSSKSVFECLGSPER